jgi:hypothetical protein
MKKVLTAALVCCAVSAFAAWDKFSVIEDGKGEAKTIYSQSRDGGSWPEYGIDFQARYSPAADFEVMATSGAVIGARYQIIPVLSFGVDVGFPIANEFWSFTPTLQFQTDLTPTLLLGADFNASFYTEEQFNYGTYDVDLVGGFELDLSLSEKSVIWVGLDLGMKMDDYQNLDLMPGFGYIATVGNLALGTWFGFGLLDEYSQFNTTFGVDATFKF